MSFVYYFFGGTTHYHEAKPTHLVIKMDRLRWSGHMERKGDTDWIRRCTMMETDSIKQRGCLRKKLDAIMLKMI